MAHDAHDTTPPRAGVRLQRVLADAGVAARRACEDLITQGHVRVNGTLVRTLPAFVDPEHDRIEVDGRPVSISRRRLYVMLHKPERVLVAGDDPGGRATVAALVDHPSGERLFPVGRLDFETTGLVLMTNDGELANRLTHPRYEVPKTYHVVVRGGVDDAAIDAIRTKFYLAARREDAEEGVSRRAAPPPDISIAQREPGRTTLEVTLREARNRLLRDVLKHLGMPVKKLTRVAIGPLRLTGVAVGHWRELTRDEIRLLRDAVFASRNRRETPTKKEGTLRVAKRRDTHPNARSSRPPAKRSALSRPATARPIETKSPARPTSNRPTASRPVRPARRRPAR
jgi:23S rRNA pseudouridine2605 synthase